MDWHLAWGHRLICGYLPLRMTDFNSSHIGSRLLMLSVVGRRSLLTLGIIVSGEINRRPHRSLRSVRYTNVISQMNHISMPLPDHAISLTTETTSNECSKDDRLSFTLVLQSFYNSHFVLTSIVKLNITPFAITI